MYCLQVMSVPKGATVVDYAYQIHTDVGNTMVGARVNGAMVDPSYELRNADVVQILTYDGPISQKAISLHREVDTHDRRWELMQLIASILNLHVHRTVFGCLIQPVGI